MQSRRDEVLDYLSDHRVATLSTHGPGGPWAAAVFYVNHGFTLTFLSSPRSRHASDLAVDPSCAAAVHEDYAGWSDIRGVQLEGTVTVLSGSRQREALARYEAKFPMIRPDRAPEPIRNALERVTWYELVASRCFFVDNSVGFGNRDEIPVS
ncbi:MAG: pyridoxamine 5'-phosphate oxidase family protein [Acidimicrobiia bacterium]